MMKGGSFSKTMPTSPLSRQRRRKSGLTFSCLQRIIFFFTGTVSLGIVWTFYRFGYELTASTTTEKKKVLPGILNQANAPFPSAPIHNDDPQLISHPQKELELRNKHPERSWQEMVETRHQSDANNNINNNDHGAPPEWKWLHDNNDPHEWKPKKRSLCQGFDSSIKRPDHGCSVNTDTLTVFCNFRNLRVDVSKITMVANGGEVLSTVMGRDEEDEFPTYQKAAFAVPTKPNFDVPTEYRSNLHYLENVLNAMRYPTAKNKGRLDLTCSTTYPGTTLFVTRYEYVNLFHTLTDWWNAFFVLPRRNGMNGGGNDNDTDDTFAGPEQIVRPDRVIFLDGHPRGLLDPVWETVFGEYHFVKHLDDGTSHGGGICFERAVFVPPGYHSPLYNDYRRKQCPHRGMARAFSDFVLDRYGLLHSSSSRASTPGLFGGLLSSSSSSSNTPPVTKPGSVVIVDRQPFVSHPRSDPNAMARKFDDAELTKLRRKLSTVNGVESVRLVRFETLSFGEQLRLLRETDVLIGIHGAALSHMLFMDETKSQTIEFQPESQLDFFEYLSEWKGMDHKIIELDYVTDALTDRGIQEAVRAVETHLSTTTNNHR